MQTIEDNIGDSLPIDTPREPPAVARRIARWKTTVGLKALMAVTGIILLLYLIFHLAGNLLVYGRPGTLNTYAALLHREPMLLWFVRIVLLTSTIVHIGAAASLWSRDRGARPISYDRQVSRSATLASRTMLLSGIGIALFIVFHILHFTTGTIAPVPFYEHDVYHNVVGGFRVGWVATIYLISMALLGAHVWHGTWASARSLGLSRPSPHPKHRFSAWVLAILLWGGFTSIPLMVILGVVR